MQKGAQTLAQRVRRPLEIEQRRRDCPRERQDIAPQADEPMPVQRRDDAAGHAASGAEQPCGLVERAVGQPLSDGDQQRREEIERQRRRKRQGEYQGKIQRFVPQ